MENSQKIKLTVIIPVYNRPERVVKALDSIPARNDIETIVVDDCSTDNTLEVLKNYNRIPITILQNEVNSGPGIARNKGMDAAHGEFITFLDSDDWLIPENINAILNQFELMENFDIIWFNNKLLGGMNWWANDIKAVFQGQFLKKSFIGDTRYNDKRWMEDQDFVRDIKAKKPIEGTCNATIYIYDRRMGGPNKEEDTLTYQYLKGNGWHW